MTPWNYVHGNLYICVIMRIFNQDIGITEALRWSWWFSLVAWGVLILFFIGMQRFRDLPPAVAFMNVAVWFPFIVSSVLFFVKIHKPWRAYKWFYWFTLITWLRVIIGTYLTQSASGVI